MTAVINAFHPDYVKTYHPDLMKEFRTHQANREERVEKQLKVKKKPLKTVTRSLSVKISKEQAKLNLEHKKAMFLNQKEFHIFNKAGMPKGVKQ